MPDTPPKKIKRVAFDKQNNNCSCTLVIDQLEKKIDDMKDAMQQEIKVVRGQLQIAIEALADQKVVLNQLLQQRAEELPIQSKFPIKNEEQLISLNDQLNSENKNTYVKAMRSLLQPTGVLKNLRNISSDEIAMAFNVDGVQGKKSLKSFQNFYNALLDSIPLNDGNGTADEKLRKAIQLQKKRIFKSACMSKDKTQHQQTQ
ncbi:uncharacterized protein LOC126764907 isoform X1 [Bactrocera neohumeralis]|uniref:uncharacterized protein LOC126764907 isoform X1 n=2 Tax=Bactrocera tyroni species complex TaxID=98808 RepID=UPI0021655DE1|nr:uncharacterized protein LOC126764907 isoform X1 [Bactrocera neohumeralis]